MKLLKIFNSLKMKNVVLLFLIFFSYNKAKVIDNNFLEYRNEIIDFNSLPILSKEIILNEDKYWVTSSMKENKKLDTNFKYKDFWLIRTYNVISKGKEITERNIISVFVEDNKYKWNREKATEVFKSIILKDNSIIIWDSFFVGMKKDDLINLIKLEEYHKEKNIIVLYSKIYKAKFHFNNYNKINRIVVERRCNDL